MPTPKLQPSRAIVAHKSDNADIAVPYQIAGGSNTTVTAFKLINSAATYITKNIKTGDVVHNDTAGTAATVVSVQSQTELTLNADIFPSTGQVYAIYAMSPQTNLGNQGCVLYVGTGGNLRVTTSGNDILTFVNVQDGTFFPINVIKLWSTGTTATNIIGLW
jgi:hypothetical protein